MDKHVKQPGATLLSSIPAPLHLLSCAPNAINYVLDDTMVVRAAGFISAGTEVTISYLGRPQLTPVEARIEALREDYGEYGRFDEDLLTFLVLTLDILLMPRLHLRV